MANATAKERPEEQAVIALETVAIDSIEPHPQNARKGSLEVVRDSLAQHGQYRGIVVNKRNRVIVAGHHTWLAAQDLGWETVAVEWVDLDPEAHKRIMIVDNRSNDLASNDNDALRALLQELAATDLGLLGTGYDEDDALLSENEGAPGSAGLLDDPGEDSYFEQYAVTIPCEDEDMQQAVYEAVTQLGYKAKAVSV